MYTKTMEKKVGKAKKTEAWRLPGKEIPGQNFLSAQRSSHCEDQNKGAGKG